MSVHRTARRLVATAALITTIASSGTSTGAPIARKRCIDAAESGQQLRKAGKLIDARRELAACTASECPSMIRRDCGRWVEELEAAIPTITIRLEDGAGKEVPDGRVTVDGEPFVRATDGRAVSIDPGMHRFVWVNPAGNVELETVVREGERNRVIVLKPPTRTQTPTGESPAERERDQNGSSPGPIPWILGGVGLGALGAGVAFWGVGLGQRSTLSSTCAPSHTCRQEDVNSSRNKLVAGDVLVGVGLIAIAASVWLLVRPADAAPRAAASR